MIVRVNGKYARIGFKIGDEYRSQWISMYGVEYSGSVVKDAQRIAGNYNVGVLSV